MRPFVDATSGEFTQVLGYSPSLASMHNLRILAILAAFLAAILRPTSSVRIFTYLRTALVSLSRMNAEK